jgi:hypothetical protein
VTPHTSSPHRRALALAALVAALASAFVALSLPGTATATPCGDKVLADWFDNGRIDRLYPPHCYEDAIDAIPDDLRNYANAEDVISRALQGALRGELVPGGADPTPDSPDGTPLPPGEDPPNDPNGDPTASPTVDTSGPSSLPIPLLVLGAMSLALLAAGGLGYLSRRRAAAAGDGDEPPGPDDVV